MHDNLYYYHNMLLLPTLLVHGQKVTGKYDTLIVRLLERHWQASLSVVTATSCPQDLLFSIHVLSPNDNTSSASRSGSHNRAKSEWAWLLCAGTDPRLQCSRGDAGEQMLDINGYDAKYAINTYEVRRRGGNECGQGLEQGLDWKEGRGENRAILVIRVVYSASGAQL